MSLVRLYGQSDGHLVHSVTACEMRDAASGGCTLIETHCGRRLEAEEGVVLPVKMRATSQVGPGERLCSVCQAIERRVRAEGGQPLVTVARTT